MSDLKFELAFPYRIIIEPTVNGGVIVSVGCAQLSYENTNKMLKALKQYFADPEAVEKAYCKCNALRAGGGPVAVPDQWYVHQNRPQREELTTVESVELRHPIRISGQAKEPEPAGAG